MVMTDQSVVRQLDWKVVESSDTDIQQRYNKIQQPIDYHLLKLCRKLIQTGANMNVCGSTRDCSTVGCITA